jgi:hypothetical protein
MSAIEFPSVAGEDEKETSDTKIKKKKGGGGFQSLQLSTVAFKGVMKMG